MKESLYEYEDENGTIWNLVYSIEPYNSGGKDEPPSGGYAMIDEIRHKDGSTLPTDSWDAAGFTDKKLEGIADSIYEYACDESRSRYEAAQESAAEARRESLRDVQKDWFDRFA